MTSTPQLVLQTQSVGPMELVLAAAPLVVAGVLLVVLLWPARRAMPVAWIVALLVGYLVWENTPTWLAAASLSGVITAVTILWIVFGALVLLYTLREAGALERINAGFVAVSDDRRVQVVLLAFFLSTFIEGAAGFGTPAAIVGPLLLAIGFPALAAVIAALIGHAIATTFGAVGTPIVVGVRTPLSGVTYVERLTATGSPYVGMEETAAVAQFSNEAAAWAATYHALAGVVMPFTAVAIVVYFFGDRSIQPALAVAPLCLFAGIAFVVPYWAAAWYLTAEFPSLIGALVGGAVTIAVVRTGRLVPTDQWDFPPRSTWPTHWVGTIEPGDAGASVEHNAMSLARAWSPYLLLVILLVVTRVVEPIHDRITDPTLGVAIDEFTVGMVLGWEDILGTGLADSIRWVELPGFWLTVTALVSIPLFGMHRDQVRAAWMEAGKTIVSPLIALVFVLAMVEVMLSAGLPAALPEAFDGTATFEDSMIDVLALAASDTLGGSYPLVAATIGALGSIIAGSVTVSNITFSGIQFTAADDLGVSRTLIVGAQATGGAIGNLVTIHNIVAALATVGLVGEEGRVMRLNAIPLIYYLLTVGILTVLFVYVLFPTVY